MKNIFALTAASVVFAGAVAAASPALASDGLYVVKGCTADNQTASLHVGVYGSKQSKEQMQTTLNKLFGGISARYKGADIKSDKAQKEIHDALVRLDHDYDLKTGSFPGGLKPGCNLAPAPSTH